MATQVNNLTPVPVGELPRDLTDDKFRPSAGQADVEACSDGKPVADDQSEFKQDGVKRVEAITTVWSKQLLIVMFFLLYLVSFIDSLLQSVQSTLIPYVTSSFAQHGLLGTTSIVATILGGVCNLFIAKLIDIWGRVEGFLFMLLLVVLGMIMKAACINVEMYAAAHTIYWVGHIGIIYVITIILADITTLKNRLLLIGINGTPLIASTFAGPRIAELFYTHVNFRWAFGAFIIIMVVFSAPVAVIFVYSKRKAIAVGVYPARVKTRSAWESFKYYFVQFDVVGMCLTIFGWSLLLMPFSLVNSAPDGWKTGYIIAMIVLGVVLLAGFAIWEKWFAAVPYIPFDYLKNRTILCACLVYGVMFCSIFCWDTYYYSYLLVVHNQSITISGYILNSFSLMSAFIGPFVGLLIRHTGDYKLPSLVVIPFAVLGTALLIHFRTPEAHVGTLVMCQLFNGIYSGVWALTGQLAIMACVSHQEIAVSLALFGLFGSIGSSIGYAIAGALWTNIFPVQLMNRLPEEAKNMTATIYGDITVQLSYEMGSPERDAIIGAYQDVQRKMVITGVAFIPICALLVFFWKNINVKQPERRQGKQAKGTVF